MWPTIVYNDRRSNSTARDIKMPTVYYAFDDIFISEASSVIATYVELRVDQEAAINAKNSGIAISTGRRRLDREPLDAHRIQEVIELMSALGYRVVPPDDNRSLVDQCAQANAHRFQSTPSDLDTTSQLTLLLASTC